MRNKFISTLLLLLIASFGFSQSFHRFPSTGARWKIEEESGTGTNSSFMVWNYYLFSDGDTVVAGYPVTKIKAGPHELCHSVTSVLYLSVFPENSVFFLFQSNSGRVYEVTPAGILYALADYSLNAGDTMHRDGGGLYTTINAVDSVIYADGIVRKRLYASTNFLGGGQPLPVVWVEGIGDVAYGPNPIYKPEELFVMHCYKENSLILVDNQIQVFCRNDCDVLLADQEPEKAFYTVYPNPSEGIWYMDALHKSSIVQVFDLNGQLVWRQDFRANQPIKIELPTAPSGMYFAKIKLQNGESQTLKLLKR